MCPCSLRITASWYSGTWFFIIQGCNARISFDLLGLYILHKPKIKLTCQQCERHINKIFKLLKIDVHKQLNQWHRDLTCDGDVESNPGPPHLCHSQTLLDIYNSLHFDLVQALQHQIAVCSPIHMCPLVKVPHVPGPQCEDRNMDPLETRQLCNYFLETIALNQPRLSDDIKLPPPSVPTVTATTACRSLPSSPMTVASEELDALFLSSPSPEDERRKRRPGVITDKRAARGGKRAARTMASLMTPQDPAKDSPDDKIERYRSKTTNTFPIQFRFLTAFRDNMHFGTPECETFTCPDKALYNAWMGIDEGLWPPGPGLCVFGWRGYFRTNSTDVKPVVVGNGIRHADCTRATNQRQVEYIIGPLPYHNKIGFFYDELWTAEHYDALSCSYRLVATAGEFALYKHAGVFNAPALWTTECSRYFVELVERTAVLSVYWLFGDRAKTAVLVDIECPSAFPNGVWMHAGSFASAAGEIDRLNYTYCKYWPQIIQGTVIYQSARCNALNLQRLNSYQQDSEFYTMFRDLFGYSQIADNLFKLLIVENELSNKNSHPCTAGTLEKPDDHNPNLQTGNNKTFSDTQTTYLKTTEAVVEQVSSLCHSLFPQDTAVPAAVAPEPDYLDHYRARKQQFDKDNESVFSSLSSYINPIPTLTCYLAAATTTRDESALYREALAAERAHYINLKTVEQEFENSTAASFPCALPTYPIAGKWRLEQSLPGAYIDGKFWDFHTEPPYDKTRIEIEFHGSNDWRSVTCSGARPEVLYWVYTESFFIPSPQAALWTCAYRTGKEALEPDPVAIKRFTTFWEKYMHVWQRPFDSRDQGGSQTVFENYEETLKNMPGAQRQKHLEYAIAVQAGLAQLKDLDFTFHCKSDEVTYLERDNKQEIYLNGKPRHIFSATTHDMYTTQGALYDIKKVMKQTEPGNPLPNPFVINLLDDNGQSIMPLYMTYGADLDNVQLGLWYTQARTSQGMHMLVGGDDNFIIINWRGFYIEFEGDISMCDQSHNKHLRDHCVAVDLKIGAPPWVVEHIKKHYTKQAHFVYKKERLATIKYKCSQLHTGNGATSLHNTITVMSLIGYGCDFLARQFAYFGTFGNAEFISATLQEECAKIGMKLKPKCWVSPPCPLATYHKKYMVWSSKCEQYVACPLPGTTLMKMCKVRCASRLKWKKIVRILIGGAESRKFCSQSPPVRALINNLLQQGTAPAYIENPYADYLYQGADHLDARGDGDYDRHAEFFQTRYEIGLDGLQLLTRFYSNLKIDQGYDLFETDPYIHSLVKKMWAVDNQ